MSALAQAADDDGDILGSLSSLARLRRATDQREAILVRRARAQGLTWAQIALMLGVTRQAVHKKYGGSRFSRH